MTFQDVFSVNFIHIVPPFGVFFVSGHAPGCLTFFTMLCIV